MPELHKKVKQIAQDIKHMKIRGAGEIARSAAEALRITAQQSNVKHTAHLVRNLEASALQLLKTRPTAVSLPNSIRYVMFRVKEAGKRDRQASRRYSQVHRTGRTVHQPRGVR